MMTRSLRTDLGHCSSHLPSMPARESWGTSPQPEPILLLTAWDGNLLACDFQANLVGAALIARF
jgi:hypothetical protein